MFLLDTGQRSHLLCALPISTDRDALFGGALSGGVVHFAYPSHWGSQISCSDFGRWTYGDRILWMVYLHPRSNTVSQKDLRHM